MKRKIILSIFFLLFLHNGLIAQVRDFITISIPPYTDTTCPGSQVTFWATQSSDTFRDVTFKWYVNSVFTGVQTDTFNTTATVSGDSIYAVIFFTNSAGFSDSDTSNIIYVYHSDTIAPRAIISIIYGNNPDCSSHWITFQVYPINGGLNPVYQWFVNGIPIIDADSNFFGGLFGDSAKIYCQMISNSPCAPFTTVNSDTIQVIHDSLTSTISISTRYDTVCFGRKDTFTATAANYGNSSHYQWYVNTTAIAGAIGSVYYTDSLHNGDSVYCILIATDSCIRNHNQKSNTYHVTVDSILNNTLNTALIYGANPGCLDSPVTIKATYTNFGTNPTTIWYIDGIQVRTDTPILDSTFLNGQLVSFKIFGTDRTCRSSDTLYSSSIKMVRDSTPVSPWISLIGNLLVANNAGTYAWYGPNGLIPGATGQTFHPVITGNYYSILDTGNCPSGPSNILYISLLNVRTVSFDALKIYPNPNTGIFILDWSGNNINMQLELNNILGESLLKEKINNQSKQEINISNYPQGNYFLTLQLETGEKITYKILKQ